MNKQPAIPTLEDVARAAGVSTATVSRCLNEKEKVSQRTLSKVMQAVDLLGYTPNYNARAMAARRSFTIGAIIPTMENAIFARGVQAFQETLHDMGYTLLVSSSAYQPELEAEQIRALVARGADGLMLIGYARDAAIYEYLEQRGVPTVLAWSLNTDHDQTSVGFDNRASMRPLAEKVLALGHKRIAVISGVIEGNDRAKGRLQGIQDSLAQQGHPVETLPVIETPYDIENGATAFAELMQMPQPPTCVMCGNDVLAVGAISKARELGIRVPDDVSITGFDDIEMSRHTVPPLTTVHVPHREMGCQAAQTLVDLINQNGKAQSVQLRTEVVMRGSLAAPKA